MVKSQYRSQSTSVSWGEVRTIAIVLTFVAWILITLPQSIKSIGDLESTLIDIPLIFVTLSIIGAALLANEKREYFRMFVFLLIPNLIAATIFECNFL